MSNILLLQEDCKSVMARYPDGYFDLAVVDPPYGNTTDVVKKKSGNTHVASRKYYQQFR